MQDGSNTLEIEVTNLAANRIADLDRGGVPWRTFYDINVVNLRYRPFDAAAWPPMASGLMGRVYVPTASCNPVRKDAPSDNVPP